jgi:hypothetical protein
MSNALKSLREGCANGVDISISGQDVLIGTLSLPGKVLTPLKSGKTGKKFELITLAFAWMMRDAQWLPYFKAATEKKIPYLVVTDQRLVWKYLRTGALSEGSESLILDDDDDDVVADGAVVGEVASSGRPHADVLVDSERLYNGGEVAREISTRTRSSILQTLGNTNLKDRIYAQLETANQKQDMVSAGASIVAAASNAKRSQSSSFASAEEARKRMRGATAAAVAVISDKTAAEKDKAIALAASQAALFSALQGSTPIIFVPPSAMAHINMHNVQRFLENSEWVAPDASKVAIAGGKPTKVTIRRTDSRGNSCQYYITDNPAALDRRDWLKVVAVFAAGPEWQFKGWKWGEQPTPTGPPGPGGKPTMREAPDIPIVKIFSRTLGFHVYLEGEAPHPNCESWAVTPLSLSRSKRYLDAGVVNKIWAAIDNIIWTKMPYLLPKGSALPGSTAAVMSAANQN